MKKLILVILICGSITAMADIEVKQLNDFTYKLYVKDQWK